MIQRNSNAQKELGKIRALKEMKTSVMSELLNIETSLKPPQLIEDPAGNPKI